jgi:hypothetical protein
MQRDEATLLDIARSARLVLTFIRGWKTATIDVPDLLATIEPLLPRRPLKWLL